MWVQKGSGDKLGSRTSRMAISPWYSSFSRPALKQLATRKRIAAWRRLTRAMMSLSGCIGRTAFFSWYLCRARGLMRNLNTVCVFPLGFYNNKLGTGRKQPNRLGQASLAISGTLRQARLGEWKKKELYLFVRGWLRRRWRHSRCFKYNEKELWHLHLKLVPKVNARSVGTYLNIWIRMEC